MGGRGSKINNPWNREGGEGHIFCKSYCVCVCAGVGGETGKGERVIYFVSHIVFVCVQGGGGGWGGGM